MDDYRNPYLRSYEVAAPPTETGDRGQAANPILLRSRGKVEPRAVRVTDRIRTLVGFGLSATHVIEADDGLIVVDTGAGNEEGAAKLPYIRQWTDKPVRAVIYSHFHYASGTSALLPDDGSYEIYAHENCDRNYASTVSTLAPVKRVRIAGQAGLTLPPDGPDADSAGTDVRSRGESGYVRPTRTICTNGEEITIRGIRVVFYTVYPFDTDCTLLVWLPDDDVVIHNHLSGNFPNIYSIGGGPFRDPLPWLAGLDQIRKLDPAHLLGCHGLPISGRESVRDVVTATRDALQLVHDQTIRAMNRGLTPREAIDFVRLPDSLANHPALTQTYGEVWHHVASIWSGLLGWYDGDAVSLVPISPAVESARIVEAFGGPAAAVDAARAACERGELGWAARLARHVRCAATSAAAESGARAVEADALRRAAMATTAWGTRNALLTQARELEGEAGRVALSGAPSIDALRASPASTSIDYLKCRVVPQRARVPARSLMLELTDIGETFALTIRNGVLDSSGSPVSPAETLRLRFDQWLNFLFQGDHGVTLPRAAQEFQETLELPGRDPAEAPLPWRYGR